MPDVATDFLRASTRICGPLRTLALKHHPGGTMAELLTAIAVDIVSALVLSLILQFARRRRGPVAAA